METKIRIGKEYKFKCIRCGDVLDRNGDVCCACLLFARERAIEKAKAELRAITQTMKAENPNLLKRLKNKAREMAVARISAEYGIKMEDTLLKVVKK